MVEREERTKDWGSGLRRGPGYPQERSRLAPLVLVFFTSTLHKYVTKCH